MAAKKNPGAWFDAPGLGKPVQATAEGSHTIARKARAKKAGTPYRIAPIEGDPFRIVVSGRTRWALDRLRAAGESGCTPITQPAPRWAAYVHNLRELGVAIETIHEKHGGAFAGTHARYVLCCQAVPQKGGAA